jgi:ABC-type nitrate/sulfonate/bicarbonate transport system permease component
MILRRMARTLLPAGVTLAIILGGWQGFIEYFSVNPLVARGPMDVWAYLFTSGQASAHRGLVWNGLSITLIDAGFGMVAGLVAAVAVAIVFVLSGTVKRAFLPVAMIVRSVPLIAMTPVITLLFGRALLATTVICGIVVFFPALVNIVSGLRSASPEAADLVRAYGGSTWTTMRKVMIPSALPSFFTSARISAPGAIVGALLAEWLATGKGIGYQMLLDVTTFESDDLWASVVVVTLASLLIYSTINVLERFVLARLGLDPGR